MHDVLSILVFRFKTFLSYLSHCVPLLSFPPFFRISLLIVQDISDFIWLIFADDQFSAPRSHIHKCTVKRDWCSVALTQ